jgi:hypothetical protein
VLRSGCALPSRSVVVEFLGEILATVEDGQDSYLIRSDLIDETKVPDDEVANGFFFEFWNHPSTARKSSQASGGFVQIRYDCLGKCR